MNCVFRDEVKRNSFTRDEVDSDYFTTFTQNFSDKPANTNKNYTNLINANPRILNYCDSDAKNTTEHETHKNTML